VRSPAASRGDRLGPPLLADGELRGLARDRDRRCSGSSRRCPSSITVFSRSDGHRTVRAVLDRDDELVTVVASAQRDRCVVDALDAVMDRVLDERLQQRR